MNPLNPLDDPMVIYLRAMLSDRIHRARTEDRSLGVSAIEWALITGMVAAIALLIFATIRGVIQRKANEIESHTGY